MNTDKIKSENGKRKIEIRAAGIERAASGCLFCGGL
jgi:hypothetical protein